MAGEVRVDAVEARAYTIPTDAPEADGTIAWDSTTMNLVEVSAGGHTGLGWTYGSSACTALVSDKLADLVRGRPVLDVPGVHLAMMRSLRNVGVPGIGAMAISAVDLALWDLKARVLELPLHRLLGAVNESVPIYGSGGFTTYDEEQLAHQLEGWTSQGIPRVKIKIGESSGSRVERDLARVAQARGVIGDDVELFVDANGGYGVGQARRVGRRLQEYDVRWFEEPVTSDDLDGLQRVRDALSLDVAAGEYGYDLSYFERMCAAASVDCLQVDITRCGGITSWFRASAVAAGHHLDVSAHCAPNQHVAPGIATPNLRHLEYFHDHVRIESMFFDGVLDPEGGALTPSDAPGTGMTFKAADAERYRVA